MCVVRNNKNINYPIEILLTLTNINAIIYPSTTEGV